MNIASLIKGIAVIFWIGLFLIIGLVAYRSARKNPLKKGGTYIVIALVAAFVLTTLSSGLVFINPEERGVVISAVSPTGYRADALTPGLRWIIPFAETVVRPDSPSRPTPCPSHRMKVKSRGTTPSPPEHRMDRRSTWMLL